MSMFSFPFPPPPISISRTANFAPHDVRREESGQALDAGGQEKLQRSVVEFAQHATEMLAARERSLHVETPWEGR
jgi:hypothetical protein